MTAAAAAYTGAALAITGLAWITWTETRNPTTRPVTEVVLNTPIEDTGCDGDHE